MAARVSRTWIAVLVALSDRQHLDVLLDRVSDLVQHGCPLGWRAATPVVLGRMCGIERELDVLLTGMRDLAEWLARRWGHALTVFAGGRSPSDRR